MKKNLHITKNNVYPNLLKIEDVKIYFLIFSTNKSVENLIFILNRSIFNYKIEKIDKLSKTTLFSVIVPIKNYIFLKEDLNFKIKEEALKFEFISIKFKNNNLSINFFEQNFLKKDIKQEYFEDFIYINYLNLFTNKNLIVKLFLIIIYNYVKLLNKFKEIVLTKI